MNRPQERWYRDGDPDQGYWRDPTDTDVTFLGFAEAPGHAVPDAPERPETPAAVIPLPERPLTRAQRLRNLISAVRSGDRSAAARLAEEVRGGDPPEAA